jgi:hypothetical protein
MSSLISNASPWVNDDVPKKRVATMNKTLKIRPSPMDSTENFENNKENVLTGSISIDNIQNYNDDKSSKINELLNKMNSTSSLEENNKMGNFEPIPTPSLIRKDIDPPSVWRNPISSVPEYNGSLGGEKMGVYNEVYNPPTNSPYYSRMGISNNNNNNDKYMEKLNYMIHLLEEQQYEKTSNITEEFLLYSFLGIFMIFVVDSFSRTAKYTR